MNKKDISIMDLKPMEFIKLHCDNHGNYKEIIYTDGKVTRVGGKEEKEMIFENYYVTHYLNVYRIDNASYISKVRYEGRWISGSHSVSYRTELISAELFVSNRKNKEMWKNIRSSIYDANIKAEREGIIPLSMIIFRDKDAAFCNLNDDSNVKTRK